MTKELQNKLYEKYPKIFRQKDLSMKETAMCWGIECGDGWFDLLDSLCYNLQFHTDQNKRPQIEAVQVKEKLGGLKFYVDECDDFQCGTILFAQQMSYTICEDCGSNIRVSTNGDYKHTQCDECITKDLIEASKDFPEKMSKLSIFRKDKID